MVLGALLHVVLPTALAVTAVLLLVGRRGRRFLRILLIEQPGREPLPQRPRRVRWGGYTAVLLGAGCAVKAAETAATTASQAWLVWTMTALAAVLVAGGGAALVLTGRRRLRTSDRMRGPASGA